MTLTQKGARKVMRTTALILIVALGLLLAPIHTRAQDARSIVKIVEVDNSWHSVGGGTGFIVSPDGTVITASHVVYKAATDPGHFGLLVLYDGANGREFFSADLMCSTNRVPGTGFSRDAAVLRIALPLPPFQTWGYVLSGGQRYDWVRHDGPLPEFPTLHISGHGAREGEPIHAPGYGHVSAIPRISVATGQVEGTRRAPDGTPLFGIRYTNPMQPGGSGSPVLNANGEVIGLIAWSDESSQDTGWAEDVSVVQHPCR